LDTEALKKRLARIFGLAFMLAGGILCVTAVNDVLTGIPDATLNAAIYVAMFSLGGMMFFWSKRPQD
jgi:hypothetical protein